MERLALLQQEGLPCPDSPPPGVVSGEVRHLAEELLNRLRGGPGDGRPARCVEGKEVLLDLEVLGVRCLFLAEPEKAPGNLHLSPREQEIARMIASGHPNKVIAAVLEISAWTVSTHLRRIFAKLGVTTRAAMVARLAERGGFGEARR